MFSNLYFRTFGISCCLIKYILSVVLEGSDDIKIQFEALLIEVNFYYPILFISESCLISLIERDGHLVYKNTRGWNQFLLHIFLLNCQIKILFKVFKYFILQ